MTNSELVKRLSGSIEPARSRWRHRVAPRKDGLVLCYHAVSDRWESPLAVTTDQLRAQVRELVSRGYRGATFSTVATAEAKRGQVAITFDDGYRSVLELARPILESFGFPATVFVPTAFPTAQQPMAWPGIDHWIDTEDEGELTPLSWSDLRELNEAGWEVGSHTVDHPRLTALDDSELDRQLLQSRLACEAHLGTPCHSIAYPYGDTNMRVVEAARRAGYRYGAALPPGRWERSTPLNVQRSGIYRADTLRTFRGKLSPALLWLRRSPLWTLLVHGRRWRDDRD